MFSIQGDACVCRCACDCLFVTCCLWCVFHLLVATFFLWINLLCVCTQQAFCSSLLFPSLAYLSHTHCLLFSLHSLFCFSVRSPFSHHLYERLQQGWTLAVSVTGYYNSEDTIWQLSLSVRVCLAACPDLTFSAQFTRFFQAIRSALHFFPSYVFVTVVKNLFCVCDVFLHLLAGRKCV